MNNKLLSSLATVLFSMASLALADNPVYNPTTDFTVEKGNPNGVWSYGWIPNDVQKFTLHSTPYPVESTTPAWFTPGCKDNNPQIWRNLGKKTLLGVAVGQLALHPGCQYEPSVLRWTAPIDGQYQIKGKFLAGDGGSMRIGIKQADQWLWKARDAGKFNLTTTITVGSPIDFIVYGGYDYGTTPLEVTITPIE